MDYGAEVLAEVIDDMKNMSVAEYEELYEALFEQEGEHIEVHYARAYSTKNHYAAFQANGCGCFPVSEEASSVGTNNDSNALAA